MSKTKISTVFIGTPDFSVPGLQSLLDDDFFDVKLVITQEDKKVGRKHVLKEPAVKQLAKAKKIKVLQPKKIIDIYEKLASLHPDLIVVIAYGQIIPEKILELPKYGIINAHASLLPKYRGASCIQASLLHRDKETGITIMKMDNGLDTGPIIHQEKMKISVDDTAGSLSTRLSNLSQKILPDILKKYINKEIKIKKQDNNLSSYVGIIKKEDGKINWNKPALIIEAQIRAMSPWPGSYSLLDNQRVKIVKIGQIIKINDYKTGTIFEQNKKLFIQCLQDSLEILELQFAGKNKITAQNFLQGYRNLLNKQFNFSEIKAPTHQ